MQPHIPPNCERALWNGLEPTQNTELVTSGGLSIDHALYGIRPVSVPHSLGPLLRISNTTFNKNFIGICGTGGHFGIGLFDNNTFNGGPIPNYAVKFCSGGALPGGIPYLNWSYAGVYANGNLRGSWWMPDGSTGNTFNTLPVGVYVVDCDASINGCTFNNILLSHLDTGMAPDMHGTAVIAKINASDRIFQTDLLTVNTADRGILAEIKRDNAIVDINRSVMTGVQNGIEVKNSGSNFECAVGHSNIICNRYLSSGLRHKATATGIDITNTGISRSLRINQNRPVDMVFQPAQVSEANPIGINVVNVSPPISRGLRGQIFDNVVIIRSGAEGIRVENAVSLDVRSNDVFLTLVGNEDLNIQGIHFVGGSDNTAGCNNVVGGNFSNTLGLWSEGSENLRSIENRFDRTLVGESFLGYHNTSCVVSGNTFVAQPFDTLRLDGIGSGLFYNNAITGHQFMAGNTWVGDYGLGAQFSASASGISHCLSQYTVSPVANVGDSTLNPAVTNFVDFSCDAWFNIQTGDEGGPNCLSGADAESGADPADALLASGLLGQLPAGMAWDGEMGLYSKFLEHPEWMGNQPAVQAFMLSRTGQASAQMNGVRAALASALVPTGGGWSQRQQLAYEKEILLQELALAWAGGDTALIGAKNADLALLEAALNDLEALSTLESSTAANALMTANAAINCTAQPCLNERWLYQVYAAVAVQKSRAMTESEAEQLRLLALACPIDAGGSVYLARSWHYLCTGERLANPCSSPFPEEAMDRTGQGLSKTPEARMAVWPNPSTGVTTVALPVLTGGGRLYVVDALGRVVQASAVAADATTFDLSLEHLPVGMYLLRLDDAFGHRVSQTKVLLNR